MRVIGGQWATGARFMRQHYFLLTSSKALLGTVVQNSRVVFPFIELSNMYINIVICGNRVAEVLHGPLHRLHAQLAYQSAGSRGGGARQAG